MELNTFIEVLQRRLREILLPDNSPDINFSLEIRVTSGDLAPGWRILFQDGEVEVTPRGDPNSDLYFVINETTASDLIDSRMNADRALSSGRIKLGGDISLLRSQAKRIALLSEAIRTSQTK